jgi:hypothetical protein
VKFAKNWDMIFKKKKSKKKSNTKRNCSWPIQEIDKFY